MTRSDNEHDNKASSATPAMSMEFVRRVLEAVVMLHKRNLSDESDLDSVGGYSQATVSEAFRAATVWLLYNDPQTKIDTRSRLTVCEKNLYPLKMRFPETLS
jgi:hypothetical protein